MLLNRDTIFVWNVQALEAHSEPRPPGILDPKLAVVVPPDVTIPSPWADANTRRLWFTAQGTQYIGALPTFDVFMASSRAASEDEIPETLGSRYAVVYQEAPDGFGVATHPTYSLITLSTWSFPQGSFKPHSHIYHCASMDLPRLTTDSYAHVRTLLYIPGRSAEVRSVGRQEDSEHKEGTVKVLAVEPHPVVTACPASGRFVYYKWDRQAHKPMLYLVDYLS